MFRQQQVLASLTSGKEPLLIVQEVGCVPGPDRTGAENFASTGIRNPDRPPCSSVAMPTELPSPLNYLDFLNSDIKC